jgi:mono/diheme cytochrome c family protein
MHPNDPFRNLVRKIRLALSRGSFRDLARKIRLKLPKKFFPHLAYNWISGIGAVLASVSFLTAVMLLLFSIFVGLYSPYFGIVIYLLLPAVMVLGLLLIPLGMWRRHRLLEKGLAGEHPPWPCIDFNDRGVRNGAAIFGVGTALFVLLGSVLMYKGYQYTESTAFCGRLCHTVMKPEYTAHQASAHTVVDCTSCHVGPGVGWYAKSKIRGVQRVFEVAVSDYPRPIPVLLSDLTPEELECHHCHWPEMFFGGRRWIFHNYRYDEDNTYWPVDIGGLWDQMACSECHTGKVVAFPAPAQPASPSPAPAGQGAQAAQGAKRPALSAAETTQVKKVYDQLCTECRGPDGKGNAVLRAAMPKLPDLTDPKWQASVSNAEIQQAILNGKGPMPASKGKLGSVRVEEMVAYVRQLARKATALILGSGRERI